MVRQPYVPERGDAVRIQFNPQAGHEQGGRRPALVLSPAAYNGKVGLAVLCPITSQAKGYPFEVRIPPGRRVGGVVLADQVKSLDWRVRETEAIESLPSEVVEEVLAKLSTLLAWPPVAADRRPSAAGRAPPDHPGDHPRGAAPDWPTPSA